MCTFIFSQFWKLAVRDQVPASSGSGMHSALLLACTQSPISHVHLAGSGRTPSLSLLILWIQNPILTASFNLNYLLKTHLQIQSHKFGGGEYHSVSLQQSPHSEIGGLYKICIFNFFRYVHIDFQSGCDNLHAQQQAYRRQNILNQKNF